jgi:hypothetical protein
LQLKKKVLAAVCALAVATSALALATPASAAPQATTPLTNKQILARWHIIEAKYTKVGDVLSASDAEFLKTYARTQLLTPNDSVGAQPQDETKTGSFTKKGSGAGATATMTGKFKSVIGTFTDNDAYIKYTATGSSKVKSVRACGHIHAYGAVGSGGVGLTYSKDDCSTVKGTKASYTLDQHYISFTAYVILDADAKYTTSSGSFTTSTSFEAVG